MTIPFNKLSCSNPRNDPLLKEELMPYLDVILSNKNTNWCLKSLALLERTKLEKNENRGVERALMQMHTLVDNLPWPKESCHSRFNLFVSNFYIRFYIQENFKKILSSLHFFQKRTKAFA